MMPKSFKCLPGVCVAPEAKVIDEAAADGLFVVNQCLPNRTGLLCAKCKQDGNCCLDSSFLFIY